MHSSVEDKFDSKTTLKGTEKSDRIYGYEGNDQIEVGAGNDMVRGGLGADTVKLEALGADTKLQANDADVWLDFNLAEGDKIDVSGLLIDANQDSLSDFIALDYNEKTKVMTVSVDRDGQATGHKMTEVLYLANQEQDLTLDQLLKNNQIIF